MEDFFSRSEALLGTQAMESLRSARVILFGVGGVGSWCAEALIRTGLTHLTIVDDDVVQPSNTNRQLLATRETIGRPKVEALRERLLTINPDAEIIALQQRYVAGEFDLCSVCETDCNRSAEGGLYIIDAIDDVPAKTDLLLRASRIRGAKVFSSMGAAFRLDPTQVRVAEFWDVKGDALARALREKMKRQGVKPSQKIRCVYSLEPAKISNHKSQTMKGSLMQVTAVFGCTLASLVISDLLHRLG